MLSASEGSPLSTVTVGAGSDVFQARGSEAFFYEELERGGKRFRGAGFLAAFAGGGCG